MTFPSENKVQGRNEVWSVAVRRSPSWLNVLVFAIALLVATSVPMLSVMAGPIGTSVIFSALFIATGFAAFNFERRTTRACVGLLWLGVGAGLLVGERPGMIGAWLVFGVTAMIGVELLSRGVGSMREAAATDALTGLRNRAGLLEQSQRAIAASRHLGQALTLVHIDIDGLKEINDTEGHAEGDRLLRLCAERWAGVARAGDILARIGGDEFLLVLPGSKIEDAKRLMVRLKEVSPVEWCFGAAELRSREEIQVCMERADSELYVAKNSRTAVSLRAV